MCVEWAEVRKAEIFVFGSTYIQIDHRTILHYYLHFESFLLFRNIIKQNYFLKYSADIHIIPRGYQLTLANPLAELLAV